MKLSESRNNFQKLKTGANLTQKFFFSRNIYSKNIILNVWNISYEEAPLCLLTVKGNINVSGTADRHLM